MELNTERLNSSKAIDPLSLLPPASWLGMFSTVQFYYLVNKHQLDIAFHFIIILFVFNVVF